MLLEYHKNITIFFVNLLSLQVKSSVGRERERERERQRERERDP